VQFSAKSSVQKTPVSAQIEQKDRFIIIECDELNVPSHILYILSEKKWTTEAKISWAAHFKFDSWEMAKQSHFTVNLQLILRKKVAVILLFLCNTCRTKR